MNLEISRLSNGLTVVTDPMPGLESAALGVWVGTGSRNETPAQMGISHMLEHMAFKGTASAQRPPDRRRDRSGGRLSQRLYQPRADRLSCPRAEGRCGAGAGHSSPTFSSTPTYEPAELERERQVVLQELGQARDTPDDIIFDHLQSVIYPGPGAGLADPGRGEDGRRFHAARSARLCRRALSRRRHDAGLLRRGRA